MLRILTNPSPQLNIRVFFVIFIGHRLRSFIGLLLMFLSKNTTLCCCSRTGAIAAIAIANMDSTIRVERNSPLIFVFIFFHSFDICISIVAQSLLCICCAINNIYHVLHILFHSFTQLLTGTILNKYNIMIHCQEPNNTN